VFDRIGGLPVHALVLHAAVVFIPLLALAAIVYAVVPAWRARIGWAVVLLGIIAPICAFVTRESGIQLYNHVVTPNSSASFRALLDKHQHFGTLTMWFTIALGVVTLVMTLATLRRPTQRLARVPDVALAVIIVALALVSGYYVYRTGDAGAHAVWG
jgi:hypothetical protein